MSARTIVIECGAAETRAALIIDDIVRRFWFGPARGEEASAPASPGEIFTGRVKVARKSGAALFVDIGEAIDGFLQLGQGDAFPAEGALVSVRVKRAARGEKGVTLALVGEEQSSVAIGRQSSPDDAALQAAKHLSGDAPVDEIIIDNGDAKAALERAEAWRGTALVHKSGALFECYGADEALQDAFARKVTLPSGGVLAIDEAEALTAIDVDASAAFDAMDGKTIERINMEAAWRLSLELGRREIGGQIVIDFLRAPRARRTALDEELKAQFPKAQKAMWTKSGLFSFTMPRARTSLLERFTELAPADPLGGRRFTIEWLARAAMRAGERRLAEQKSSRITLTSGAHLYEYLANRPNWTKALGERYGERLSLIKDDNMEDRAFELSEG